MSADVGTARSEASAEEMRAGEGGAARRSAFASVPVSDYVTDALALVLLLVSLTLPWTTKNGDLLTAGDVAWVLPVTLISVLSLTLPYLARFGILPAAWTVHSTRRARLWANLPYVLVVVVHLVLDGAGVAGYRGLGTAAALGLAGAVLAATPRRCELGPEEADATAKSTWWTITVAMTLAVVVVMVVWLVLLIIGFFQLPSFQRDTKDLVLLIVEFVAVGLVLLAPALMAVLRRSAAWRNVSTAFGIVLVVVFFVSGPGQTALESLRSFDGRLPVGFTGAGVILLPALAALLASPAVSRSLREQHPVTSWLLTGNAALRFIAIISGALLVVTVVALVSGLALAAGITACVLLLIALLLALIADRALLRNIGEGRKTALIVSGLVLLLGLSLIVTAPITPLIRWVGSGETLTWALVALALGMPILLIVALTGPVAVREFFTTNAPPAHVRTGAYEWAPPAKKPNASDQYAVAPQQDQSGYPAGQQSDYGQPGAAAQGGQVYGQTVYDQNAQSPASQPASPAGTASTSLPQQGSPVAPITTPGSSAGAVAAEPTPTPVSPVQEVAHPQTEAVTDRLDVRDISSGFTPEIAADPATPAAVLAQIVEEAPHLRPEVAANPSTYPALLDWLRELGDPAVDEALRNRGL